MASLLVLMLMTTINAVLAGSGTTASDPTLYCVVGSGPAGLQLARHFEDAGRNYVLFERGPSVATFYRKFPIHRNLISINKRHTGFSNPEFNMRHDWNSILNGSATEPFKSGPPAFTTWSDDFFPHTDVMVKYLENYAEDMEAHIQFDTDVSKIHRAEVTRVDDVAPSPGESKAAGFRLGLRAGRADAREHFCQVLILAVGLYQARALPMVGWEHTVNYADISPHGKDFANERVAIIGNGNTAHEISQELLGHSAHNHLFSRQPTRLSFHTHYVGDVRAVNLGTLDTYQLKSLDAVIDLGEDFVSKIMIVKCRAEGRRIRLGVGDKFCLRQKDEVLTNYLESRGHLPTNRTWTEEEKLTAATDEAFWDLSTGESYSFRTPYDRVIAAVGWTFDASIFADGMVPVMVPTAKDRFPAQKCNFESVNVDNLHFAGVLQHARDYRRSAGGFIHGFRYLGRALFKTLERDYHTPRTAFAASVLVPPSDDDGDGDGDDDGASAPPPLLKSVSHWPGTETFALSTDNLLKALKKRVGEASGLYQMFGELVDVILLDVVRGEAQYMQEVPRCMCAPPTAPQQHANWGNNTFAANVSAMPWDPSNAEYKAALVLAKAAAKLTTDAAAAAFNSSTFFSAPLTLEVGADGEPLAALSAEEEITALRAKVSELMLNATEMQAKMTSMEEEAAESLADEHSGIPSFTHSKGPAPMPGAWHDAAHRSCAMCDDRFDKIVLSFQYRHDFHGPGTVGRGRVGSQSHHTAHRSTFLHPVIEFIPKSRTGWAFAEDAPGSSVHLVEDVQALWETEAEHMDPLRSWLAHLTLNLTIADVLSDAAFLDPEEGAKAASRGVVVPEGRVEELSRLVELAGDTETVVATKSSLWPGMRVRLTQPYSTLPAGAEGVFLASEPAYPPAVVRFSATGDWSLPVHWEHLEIMPGELERAKAIQDSSLKWEGRYKRSSRLGEALVVVLDASYVHYPAIWKATEKANAEAQSETFSKGGSRGASLSTDSSERFIKFRPGERGTVVGYNSIDGAVIADGEPLEFPPLASGARVQLEATPGNGTSPGRNVTVINVAWHELMVWS